MSSVITILQKEIAHYFQDDLITDKQALFATETMLRAPGKPLASVGCGSTRSIYNKSAAPKIETISPILRHIFITCNILFLCCLGADKNDYEETLMAEDESPGI
jgi:hypothetical protein